MQTKTDRNGLKRRLQFFRLDDCEFRSFPAIQKAIGRHASAALDAFYQHVAQMPEECAPRESEAYLRHAREQQVKHWRALFSGNADAQFEARSESIGQLHAQIGLDPTWYVAGYAFVLEHVLGRMLGRLLPGSAKRRKAVTTFVKSALLDIEIALSAHLRSEERKRSHVIGQVSVALARMSEGDLAFEMETLPTEYSKLAEDLEATRLRIRQALRQVATTADSVELGANHISQLGEYLSSSSDERVPLLVETASMIREVSQAVRNRADGTVQMSGLTEMAHLDIEEGERAVSEAIAAMEGITRTTEAIAGIVGQIGRIASRTNELALNSEIQAVHAGDDRNGFALIAGEVRALAESVAETAQQFKSLNEVSMAQVVVGAELLGRANQALNRTGVRVGKIATHASQISSVADAQTSSLEQTAVVLEKMYKTARGNAAMIEGATSTARSLAVKAEHLKGLAAQFRVGRGDDPWEGVVRQISGVRDDSRSHRRLAVIPPSETGVRSA